MCLDEDAGKLVFNRLRATLSDGNLRVRRAGAQTLAGMCLPEVWGKKPASFAAQAVSELTFHLADADPLVRKVAQEPLDALQKKAIVGDVVVAGQAALPSLKARLHDEDWQVRDATVRALGRLSVGGLSCAKDIARMLTDDSAVCRDSAKKTLERMLGAGLAAADLQVVVHQNVELFVTRLKHEDPKVRCAACWVLGHAAPAVLNLHGMAEVLVKESNHTMLAVASECINVLKLGALPAAPEIALGLKGFMSEEGHERLRAVRSPAGISLMQLHQEVVAVIGRAITRDPRIKDAIQQTQHFASRLGRDTNLQREEGVSALMRPAPSHVAAITELLRVILDPESPGAQAGVQSYLAAVGCLDSLRDAGLLGGFDQSKVDIVHELLDALEDPSWTVRLASAEALATLSCQIRPFLQCLRKHRKSENEELKAAAQKFWQTADVGKVFTHARVMSESAVKTLRGILHNAKPGQFKETEKQFIRSVSQAAISRLTEAGVIEKPQHHGHHPGRLVQMKD